MVLLLLLLVIIITNKIIIIIIYYYYYYYYYLGSIAPTEIIKIINKLKLGLEFIYSIAKERKINNSEL